MAEPIGRAELYGDAFLHNYRLMEGLDRDAIEKALRQHDFRWTFLRSDNQANAYFKDSPQWRRLYADAYATVYVRNPR